MIGATVKRLEFNAQPVLAAKDKAAAQVHRRWGGFVRKVARRSLKRARQKKLSELTDGQRQAHEINVEQWERGGRQGPRPRRPEVRAQRGQPPKLHSGNSPLKRLLLFDADATTVVVGPRIFAPKTGAPRLHVLKLTHPFMEPAAETAQPLVSQWWRDAM